MDTKPYVNFRRKLKENISKAIVGKDEVIDLLITSFICSGHVLVEDIPGVGKTMLVRAFAKSLGSDCKRIQFTPDILPSDLTGINFYNQKKGEFEFRKGPLFTNIVLADEINRATPRTQSSLLEAMEERQITADGVTTKLSDPFMVLATQNPLESYGTFPLPEAQLDRFFMRISMGYPSRNDEIAIAERENTADIIEGLGAVTDVEEIAYIKRSFKDVSISEDVKKYIMDIIEESRRNEKVHLGVSPRGTISLLRASKVWAALSGRDYVIPEDVKLIARYVLNHRIILKGLSRSEGIYESIEEIIQNVDAPLESM